MTRSAECLAEIADDVAARFPDARVADITSGADLDQIAGERVDVLVNNAYAASWPDLRRRRPRAGDDGMMGLDRRAARLASRHALTWLAAAGLTLALLATTGTSVA